MRCFGGRNLTVTAWIPSPNGIGSCPGDVVPGDGWLLACDGRAVLVTEAPGETPGVSVHFPPALGIDALTIQPERWARVVGHFDDAAARACQKLGPDGQVIPDPSVVEGCRGAFVASEFTIVA
ncbi:MAG: hypothetical protein ABI622_09705, partial [Chloroflexota bacterium]